MIIIQSLLLAMAVMTAFWMLSRVMKNAGVVDIGWAVSLAGLAVLYTAREQGNPLRSALLLSMVLSWATRLVFHLSTRMLKERHEDQRYQRLRREWAPNIEMKFFMLFQAEALLAVVLATPFVLAAFNPDPALHPIEWLAVAVWLMGFWGEMIADQQLRIFKLNPQHNGKTCDAGLWAYSRHPNYFFEWVIWFSYALFVFVSPWGWLGMISPLLMYFILVHVTGVPFAEAQSLRSRGDEYRLYQKRTSPFFPLPRKKVVND